MLINRAYRWLNHRLLNVLKKNITQNKFYLKLSNKNTLLLILQFFFIFILLIGGQYYAKKGVNFLKAGSLQDAYLSISIGYIFFISRGLIWIFLLKENNIYVAYSIQSLSFIFIMLLAYFTFDEPITVQKITSAILIVTGITIVLKFKK